MHSFILKWWATAISMAHVSKSTFSGNVMAFLCILGALPTPPVTLCMGPSVLFKVYSIALNPLKSQPEPWSLFTLKHNVLERGTAHLEMTSITWCFNQVSQLLSSPSYNRRWLWNGYSSAVCTTVHFTQLWFITLSLHLFTFLLAANGTMYGL